MTAHVIQFAVTGSYWRGEPAADPWTRDVNQAAKYTRVLDLDRALTDLRAKFQRHNRAALKAVPLEPAK